MSITEGTQPAAITWTGNWTTAQTTASFTPEAGALLVAILSGSTLSSGTAGTGSITDSLSGTWTLLKRQNTQMTGLGGTAEVWCRDSTNQSMTVSATQVTGTANPGGQLVVRTLIGAKLTASQNGATGGVTVNPATVQVSVAAGTGNKIYGAALNWTTSAAMTVLANTVNVVNFVDNTNGDNWAAFKSSADTAGTDTFGYSTSTQAQLAAVEILAAPVAAGGGARSAPGQTWRRRFHHPQLLLQPSPIITAAVLDATPALVSPRSPGQRWRPLPSKLREVTPPPTAAAVPPVPRRARRIALPQARAREGVVPPTVAAAPVNLWQPQHAVRELLRRATMRRRTAVVPPVVAQPDQPWVSPRPRRLLLPQMRRHGGRRAAAPLAAQIPPPGLVRRIRRIVSRPFTATVPPVVTPPPTNVWTPQHRSTSRFRLQLGRRGRAAVPPLPIVVPPNVWTPQHRVPSRFRLQLGRRGRTAAVVPPVVVPPNVWAPQHRATSRTRWTLLGRRGRASVPVPVPAVPPVPPPPPRRRLLVLPSRRQANVPLVVAVPLNNWQPQHRATTRKRLLPRPRGAALPVPPPTVVPPTATRRFWRRYVPRHKRPRSLWTTLVPPPPPPTVTRGSMEETVRVTSQAEETARATPLAEDTARTTSAAEETGRTAAGMEETNRPGPSMEEG